MTRQPEIPGFEIRKQIGRGAVAVVYRALQRGVEREVALKVVTCASALAAERLAREARIAGSMDHPGLVRIHASGVSEGDCWLAMELIEGESLQQKLERGPLPWDEVLSLLLPVLEGLALLHAQGVVHRDIKPSNILVDAGGRARLTDFGLARAAVDAGLTVERGALGTPLYMAPEQVSAPSRVDARADVWSCGVLLHALLTGRPAFAAHSLTAVLARVTSESLPPLESDVAVPKGTDALLAVCTSKSPGGRPANAAELLSALARLGAPKSHSWRRRTVAAGAAAGVVLVAWAAWMAIPATEENAEPTRVVAPASSQQSVPSTVVQQPAASASFAQLLAWWHAESSSTMVPQETVAAVRERLVTCLMDFIERTASATTATGFLDEQAASRHLNAGLSAESAAVPPALLGDSRVVNAWQSALRAVEHAARTAEDALCSRTLNELQAIALPAGVPALAEAAVRDLVAGHVSPRVVETSPATQRAIAEAQQQAVQRLMDAGHTARHLALTAAESLLSQRRHGEAEAAWERVEHDFAEALPDTREILATSRARMKSAEAEFLRELRSARALTEKRVVQRADASVLDAAMRTLDEVLLRQPIGPVSEEGLETKCVECTTLLRAVRLARETPARAAQHAATHLRASFPLRLVGEPARGPRRLTLAQDGRHEFERMEDGQRTTVNWAALDGSTQVALAGLGNDALAPALILIARMQAGDAGSIWESLQGADPLVVQLGATWQALRRERLNTADEQAAAAALLDAARALSRGEVEEALQSAGKVNALRAAVRAQAGEHWPELLREAQAIQRTCEPIARTLREWRGVGWACTLDWDAQEVVGQPKLADGCITLTDHSAAADGDWRLEPRGPTRSAAGDESVEPVLEVALPAGVWSLEFVAQGLTGALHAQWGSENFLAVGTVSDPHGAAGEALHGLERSISRSVSVNRALIFRGAAAAWRTFWKEAVSFPMAPHARWFFQREADGRRALQCGAARMEFPAGGTLRTTLKLAPTQRVILKQIELRAAWNRMR